MCVGGGPGVCVCVGVGTWCVCVCVGVGTWCVCVCVCVCGSLTLTMEHILHALNPLISLGTDDRDIFCIIMFIFLASSLVGERSSVEKAIA